MNFIYIEGNIGSGKTTICNRLKKNGYTVYLEPVEEWIKDKKLEQFYKGEISAFDFQKYITGSMYDRQKQAIKIDDNKDEFDKDDLIIFERSVWSTLLFTYVLGLEDKITEKEMNNIQNLVDALHKAGTHIYIRTDYGVCRDRIELRNRGEESNISLNYLQKLEDIHDDLLKNSMKVNGNGSIEEVFIDTIYYINMIHSEIIEKRLKPTNINKSIDG